jgi:ABC-type Fe3+ transport system substrate-binding protein
VVARAKEEGEVSVAASWGPKTRAAIIRAVKDRYNIDAKVSAGGAQGGAKILVERGAGLFQMDVSIHGANRAVNVLKPAGALDVAEPTLMLEEVKDPKVWFGGKFPWFDRDRTIIQFFARLDANLAVNTGLVKPGEIKSYRDLLKPQWKGKILLTNPSIIGTGSGWFRETGKDLGMDFMRALVGQKPVILNDSKQVVEWLARGKYPVLIAGNGELLAEFVRDGLPVAIVEAGDTRRTLSPSSGMVSLINRAPHPHAAKVFLNWILTREGQTIMTTTIGLPSRRLDAPTAHLLPIMVPQPGQKYIEYTEESVEGDEEAHKLAKEIFGPLMK